MTTKYFSRASRAKNSDFHHKNRGQKLFRRYAPNKVKTYKKLKISEEDVQAENENKSKNQNKSESQNLWGQK